MKGTPISRITNRLLALALLLIGAFASVQSQAQTYTVIYNFTGGNDGANPAAGLVEDGAGNLYGTASSGGATGSGVVFEVTESGQETVLYTFGGFPDGISPTSSLLMDKHGNLYGTTYSGGANYRGAVFKLSKAGQETLLYSFTGGADGTNPNAALIFDKLGNLYGTTTEGGTYGGGTVFELSPRGEETVLYEFGNGTDGATPLSGLTMDSKGRLYGTTSAGGSYTYGTVFQLTAQAIGPISYTPPKLVWKETILYNFTMQSDGGIPYGGLTFDKVGNLYGTATDGGGSGFDGGGTVFELTPFGSEWNFNLLYSVPGWGISGTYQDVIFDSSGNLYATTHCDGTNGYGSVYELTPTAGTWSYTPLYNSTGGTDGFYFFTSLVFDKNGNLYGTTRYGGEYGNGVVFKVTQAAK